MELELFNKNQLLQDLKRFGLNPREWQLLDGLSDQPQLITHKKEENFFLLGIVKKGAKAFYWADIQVLSI